MTTTTANRRQATATSKTTTRETTMNNGIITANTARDRADGTAGRESGWHGAGRTGRATARDADWRIAIMAAPR